MQNAYLDSVWAWWTTKYSQPGADMPQPPPKKFATATWDAQDAPIQAALTPALDGQQNVAILGPPGVGKSFSMFGLAYGVLDGVMQSAEYQAMDDVPRQGYYLARKWTYIEWGKLDQLAQDRSLFGEVGSAAAAELERLKKVTLLGVDDFGVHQPHSKAFGVIHSLFTTRDANCLATTIATNKSEAELVVTVGGALVDRLFSGVVVQYNGQSRRRKPATVI